MQRAKNEQGPDITKIIDEYRGPVFGYASMNFYAEFLAAVDVYKSYEQHFGQLVLDKPAATVTRVAATKPATAKPKAAEPADKYKVRTGDTLWEIAQRFGTSIREIMDKNNLSRPVIYAGQLLLIK